MENLWRSIPQSKGFVESTMIRSALFEVQRFPTIGKIMAYSTILSPMETMDFRIDHGFKSIMILILCP